MKFAGQQSSQTPPPAPAPPPTHTHTHTSPPDHHCYSLAILGVLYLQPTLSTIDPPHSTLFPGLSHITWLWECRKFTSKLMLQLFLLLVTVLNCLSALLDVTETHHRLKTHYKKPVPGIPSVHDRGMVSRAVLSVDS